MGFSNFDPDEGGGWSRAIRNMMQEMLQRQMVGFRSTATWGPALNVYERLGGFVICADLAGMRPDRIDVQCLSHTRIRIAGRREHPRISDVHDELSIHVMEIDEGPFHREIDLPEAIDTQRVSARYEDGYLWVHLPKRGDQA